MKQFSASCRIFLVLAVAMLSGAPMLSMAQNATKFNDYGWSEGADEKVSEKSVVWLKSKGWWPL